MHKDLLPDFLHLCHSFATRSQALLQLLEHFNGDPRLIRQSDPDELRALGFMPRAIARVAANQARQVERGLAWA